MNAQSRDQSQRIAMAGVFLLLVGLLIAIFYAIQCRYDIATRQLSDQTFVVLGVSLQLVGLGLIIWKK
jgi:protein-S-isoprenylcysteine O-methyltransferase Ste14